MNQLTLRTAVVVAALAVTAGAQPMPESFSALGAARFDAAMAMPGSQFRPTLSPGAPALTAAEAAGLDQDISDKASLVRATEFVSAAPALTSELDLAALLNRHLKTRLHFVLSGRSVWFSGAFDRGQKPFVSVLVDGQAARYFDVRALLSQDQSVSVGGTPYTLSLSANIFHKMKSTISLKNDADSRQTARFSVQDMLDAVSAAGEPVNFSDQQYRFYYADGVDGGGRMFVFICGSTKDFHVYLVPEALVPSDKLGVFKMFNDKRVGLAQQNGRLLVYENP
jgi:hypothetical protein